MHKNIFKHPNLSIKNFDNSFSKDQADRWFESSLNELNWLEGEIKLFGKNIKISKKKLVYSNYFSYIYIVNEWGIIPKI